MWRPALRPEDLDAERQVILDEILMHADEPSDEAAEQSSALLFPEHPLGREVLGTQDSVPAMTVDRIRDFFALHYRPGNMVVAVAGDLDHEEVAGRTGGQVRGRPGGVTPSRTRPTTRSSHCRWSRRGTEQAHLVLASRSVHRLDHRRYALAVVNHVLGGGLSSRLFQEIRERRGLAYSVWSERVPTTTPVRSAWAWGRLPNTSPRSSTSSRPSWTVWARTASPSGSWPSPRGTCGPKPCWPARIRAPRMSRIGAGLLLHGEILSVDDVLARVEALTLEEIHAAAGELVAAPRTPLCGRVPSTSPTSMPRALVSAGPVICRATATVRRAAAPGDGRVAAMRVGVVGAGGRMGREVCRAV